MRFLEARVRRDPEDAGANARLAGVYLQRLRETGSIDYLELASRAARASLASVPPSRNTTGLAALARTEIASHDFAAARDHAVELTKLDSSKGSHYALLSDALLELGDYEASQIALQTMARLNGRLTIEGESRQARHALLRGDVPEARRYLSNALALARSLAEPPRETIAWSQWQLGEYAFSIGDYQSAERLYGDSLATFPGYFNALAAMARVRAARGDLKSAIDYYERAVQRLPDPTFAGALGDLYKLAGREKDAAAQYRLVGQIGYLSAASGALYNRQLALFHADHGMQGSEAYASAVKEYEVRHDIFGADAVAWTALKANRIEEAQTAIKQALRLGTQDARLFYHAGMIARAAGDEAAARAQIAQAMALNPQFDPLQASILHAEFGQ
jgi:tetratricopeptide (TPR) repeat protein